MAVQLTYTGTPFVDQIRQQGFKPGGIFSVAPRQIFSTTSPAFASTYGTPIKLATPKSAFSLPSFNFSSGVSGKEVIQSPKAATKGMRLAEMAERLKNVSPTAKNLLAGKTVSGFGGVTPSLASKALGATRAALFSPFGLAFGAGQGIGFLADQATRAMNTPEAYEFITNVTKNDPFAFDETNMDVGNIFTQQASLNNPENKQLQELVAQGGGYNIPGITDRGGIIDATPIFASEDIAARNVGVPQDNRFTGIMRNIARGPLFSGGVQAGLTAGELLTGAASLPFALAGGIASQFLPLDRSKPDFDYQYVNNPDNMGGLSVVDNKIVDPSGILSGKNFESAFGSKNLGEMYDKEISRLGGFITDLEEEEEKKGGLSKKDAARLERLQTKQQIARNRLQDYLSSGPTIPGTNITRAQFARDYNIAQQNIGSDYDALDAQSYSSLGGGEQTTTVDGQDITSYTDPYDPGTDD